MCTGNYELFRRILEEMELFQKNVSSVEVKNASEILTALVAVSMFVPNIYSKLYIKGRRELKDLIL